MSDKKTKPAAKATGKDAPAKGKGAAAPASKGAPKSTKAKAAAPAPVAPAAPSAPVVLPSEAKKEHSFRRKIIGTVVSAKMQKTVVVEVIRRAMNPMYKKYVRVRNKYKAHDETNSYKVGDRVEIMEHRPISKHKRWLVTRLVSRPVEA
jgi:small subunit ribosomal protein S17